MRTIYDEGFCCLIPFGPKGYVRLSPGERKGTFIRTAAYSLAASGDFGFPSLPILFGLRLGQRDGAPWVWGQAVVAYAYEAFRSHGGRSRAGTPRH